jgi:hypothetical protein
MENKDWNKLVDIEGLDIYKVDTNTMLEKLGASIGWNSCSNINRQTSWNFIDFLFHSTLFLHLY